MKLKNFLLKNLFVIIFIFGGAIVLLKGIYGYYNESKSFNWPSTAGKIISVETKREDGVAYFPEVNEFNIKCEYSVGSNTYKTTRLFHSSNYIVKYFDAENQAYQIEQMGNVPVYYDPKDPENSFLFKAKTFPIQRHIVGALWFILIPVFGSMGGLFPKK